MRSFRTFRFVVGSAVGLCVVASAAHAGPDVVVSNLGPEFRKYGTREVGSAGGGAPRLVTGYAAETVACNIGDAPAIWIDNTNQHPVIGQQLYRLHNGRFEQIGMSWIKHAFCAADSQSCINLVPGAVYVPDLTCATLGLFAFDTYSASLNGQQFTLGARSEVNAATGAFPFPNLLGWNTAGDCLYKRLQVANADLTPQTHPGARYFFEAHYVASDEASSQRINNAGYREVLVGSLSNGLTSTGCPNGVQGYPLAFTGTVFPFKPAIEAWRASDPAVTLIATDIPGDGRIIIGARATPLGGTPGGGVWQYEYAIYNHNSDRGIGSFTLPKSTSPAVAITQLGFHDVEYHSGEPYSGADWSPVVTSGSVEWATEPLAANPNANAIRWGTLYNFRFQADRAPVTGTVTLGLFKPSSDGIQPATVRIPGLPVPADRCIADFDNSGGVALQDLFDYLVAYFAGDPRADLNHVGGNTVQDLFDFLAAWFAGC